MSKESLLKTIGNALGQSMKGLGMLLVGATFVLIAMQGFAAGPPPLSKTLGPAGAGLYGEAIGATVAAPSIGSVAAQVIAVFFGLLGIIFVVLMVYGGFQWMTAAGNPEQVKKAQKLMLDAVIGILILMTASFISYWVLYIISTKIVTT